MQVSKKFWQVPLALFLQQLLEKKPKSSHREPNQPPTEWSTWLQWKSGLSKECRKKPHHVTVKRMSRENKRKFQRAWAEDFQNNTRNWSWICMSPALTLKHYPLSKKLRPDRAPNMTHIDSGETQSSQSTLDRKVTLIWQLFCFPRCQIPD